MSDWAIYDDNGPISTGPEESVREDWDEILEDPAAVPHTGDLVLVQIHERTR